MNRIVHSITLTLALLGFGVSRVHAETTPAVLKIGVVNLQQALNEVEEGKKAKANLKSNFDKEQKKLEIMKKEVETLQQDYEKQRLVSTGTDLKSKEDALKTKITDLQNALKNSQQTLSNQELAVTGKILQNLKGMVQEIGKKENYSLILENSQDALLYSQQADDLTPKLISMYNSKSK